MERGVAGGGRGGDPQLPELGPDQAVDEVLAGERGVEPGRDLAGERDQDVAVGEDPPEPGRDGGLARDRPGLGPALGVGGDQGRLARLEGGQVGDVAVRAVGVRRPRPGAGTIRRGSGSARSARRRRRTSSGRRAGSGASRRRSSRAGSGRTGEPTSSFRPPPWGTCGGGLLEQEAPLGRGGEDPTAPGLAGDGGVVGVGVEAQERELEAVLPAGLAVAGPGVAAGPGEDRLDVALERGPVGAPAPGGTPRVAARSQAIRDRIIIRPPPRTRSARGHPTPVGGFSNNAATILGSRSR